MERTIPQGLADLFASAERTYMNPVAQREVIKKDNSNLMGIYCWVNLINGNIYVGRSASVTLGLYQRLSDYYQPGYLAHPRNQTSLICLAMQKHGMANFALLILDYCDPQEETIVREQHYLTVLDAPYNTQNSAGHFLGVGLGVPVSAEQKKKSWDAQWGTKTIVHGPYDCPETHAILAQQKTPTWKYSPKTSIHIQDVVYSEVYATFYSWRSAAAALNLPHNNLMKHVKTNVGRPYNGRYKITVTKVTDKKYTPPPL